MIYCISIQKIVQGTRSVRSRAFVLSTAQCPPSARPVPPSAAQCRPVHAQCAPSAAGTLPVPSPSSLSKARKEKSQPTAIRDATKQSKTVLRKIVFNFQKRIAYNIPKGYKGSVLNGRDITHNIIPDATFKFYVTASIFERSRRRYRELKKLRKKVSLSDIVKSLKKRDQSDKNRSRKQGRLEKTKDSRLINTTRLSINGCFLKVKKIIDRELKKYERS